jgi:hypothetical protein
MATAKVVFIAFAKEDERSRNLFTGQRLHTGTPFEWTDMSVKEPGSKEWKEKVRTRLRRSDGVVALISQNTPKATGELWEIQCAVEEKKPLLGIWLEDGYRIKPTVMGSAPCKPWPWDNVAKFISLGKPTIVETIRSQPGRQRPATMPVHTSMRARNWSQESATDWW